MKTYNKIEIHPEKVLKCGELKLLRGGTGWEGMCLVSCKFEVWLCGPAGCYGDGPAQAMATLQALWNPVCDDPNGVLVACAEHIDCGV